MGNDEVPGTDVGVNEPAPPGSGEDEAPPGVEPLPATSTSGLSAAGTQTLAHNSWCGARLAVTQPSAAVMPVLPAGATKLAMVDLAPHPHHIRLPQSRPSLPSL